MKSTEEEINEIFIKNNVAERVQITSHRMLKMLSNEFKPLDDAESYQSFCQTTLATLIPSWFMNCFEGVPKDIKKKLFVHLIEKQKEIFEAMINIDSKKTVN